SLPAKPEFLQHEPHQLAVTGIPDRLVVEAVDTSGERSAHRPDAARGGERLVARSVDYDRLQVRERRDADELSSAQLLAVVQILVDDPGRRPVACIAGRVVRAARKRAGTQLDSVDRLKAGRKPTAND